MAPTLPPMRRIGFTLVAVAFLFSALVAANTDSGVGELSAPQIEDQLQVRTTVQSGDNKLTISEMSPGGVSK